MPMDDRRSDKVPKTQPASAGGPPRPPKKTARGLDEGSSEDAHIDIPDPVKLKDLAGMLGQKLNQRPVKMLVKIIVDLRFLAPADGSVNFETAATIAKKYGFHARRAA